MRSRWPWKSCSASTVPKRGQLIRVLYSEIGRILSHLLNITTQALDVGALTPPLWGFEEREKLMVFYERACGARLHAAYFRPGGVHQDLPQDLVEDIGTWCDPFLKTCADDIEASHRQPHLQAAQCRHRRCQARRRLGLGLFRRDGPRLGRRLGPAQVAALRVLFELDFDIPIGKNGDCYDRYLIRMEEMRQSVKIMKQCVRAASRKGAGSGRAPTARSCRPSAAR
jgi:NADH-quinone oxidoreductase subunit D